MPPLYARLSLSLEKRAIDIHRSRSMPRLHSTFLLVVACALLFLCAECTASLYQYCLQNGSKCGNTTIAYPFGIGNYGCGDPDFQLYCVQSNPVLSINRNNYSVLSMSNTDHTIRIVDEKLLQQTCDPSNAYDDLRNDSHFHIAKEYAYNLNLLRCRQSPSLPLNRLNCSSSWYYGLILPTDWRNDCSLQAEVPVSSNLPWEYPYLLYQGVQIEWYSDPNRNQSCASCKQSNGICGYNVSDPQHPFICICEDDVHSKNCHDGEAMGKSKKSERGIIIGGTIGGVVLIGVLIGALCGVFNRRRRNLPPRVSEFNCEESRDIEAKALAVSIGTLPIFTYEELERATNCFHEDNELGGGGFGTVYLGKLGDGRAVAVKKLHQVNSRGVKQFINEAQILSSLHHPNLVRLFGSTCPDSQQLLLVYEYVPNGTLADHLHGERKGKGLIWDIRLNIAIQTAQALAFLHGVEPPIFHRDVKSTNILLDQNFQVKVADFGLSRLVPFDVTHVTTAPQGTPGYLDPDYHQCYQLTEKSDVYSFGVVLVEIISAKLAVDITRDRKEISLANMAIAKIQNGTLHELVDPNLKIESNPRVKAMVTGVAELAFRCLAPEKDDRPYMKEVAAQLEHIRQMADADACPDLNFESQKEHTLLSGMAPYSPTSVHEKWLSTSTTPNASE